MRRENVVTCVLAAGAAFGAMLLASPDADADPTPVLVTVDGVDYPLCAEEDCSDQPGQVGVWRNDGRDWLIVGEDTWPVTR